MRYEGQHDLRTRTCLATLVALASLAGCASVSPLSGAKTLAPGTGEVAVAVEALLPADDSASSDDVPVGLGPVISYRRGLSDAIDASFRLYYIGMSADVRYALAKGRLSASIGAQAGTSSVGISIGDSKDEFSVKSLEMPLYLEYAFTSSSSILAVPRIGVARFGKDDETSTSALALLAIGFPIHIGKLGLLPSITAGYYGEALVVGATLGVSF